MVSTLIFDCDGVLADTERDGHRVAFNATFREFGIPVEWSEEEYAVKLQIAGGKERMASLLTPEFVRANGLPADADGQAETLASWHKRKTAIYTDMVAGGTLPTRPGIRRIIAEAQDAGWTLGVASTSAEPSVRAILERAAGASGPVASTSCSPATSSSTRSPLPTSISWPSSGSACRPQEHS